MSIVVIRRILDFDYIEMLVNASNETKEAHRKSYTMEEQPISDQW